MCTIVHIKHHKSSSKVFRNRTLCKEQSKIHSEPFYLNCLSQLFFYLFGQFLRHCFYYVLCFLESLYAVKRFIEKQNSSIFMVKCVVVKWLKRMPDKQLAWRFTLNECELLHSCISIAYCNFLHTVEIEKHSLSVAHMWCLKKTKKHHLPLPNFFF